MAIGKRLRFEILKRDGFTCRYCGAKGGEVKLQVDHIKPRALGGSDHPDNLIAACKGCNVGKSAVPLSKSQIPKSPIDAVVDAALWDASVGADEIIERREEELGWAIGTLDALEFYFPDGVPAGFM